MSVHAIRQQLKKLSNDKKAIFYQRFFKTAPGEYSHGDQFIGVTVPHLRALSKQFKELPRTETLKILTSPIHEERLLALFILVLQYQRGDDKQKKSVYDFYVKKRKYVNNWDLVDTTCHKIIGAHLHTREKDLLYKLAKSRSLWDKRIAMMSTYYFIKREHYEDALNIAELLKDDSHDLIHKVVGWMLREIGKKDLSIEETFLKKYYKTMPRTMLRYAIEHFPETLRKKYLLGKV